MVVRFYSSVAPETTLSGTINSGATTIVVGDVTGLPGSFPYTLALDYESASEELVDVTAAAGTSLTITRAVDGTNATSHSAGARVRHVSSGRDYRDSRDHENSNVQHGATGAVVGTTNTQTLTNKTLTSPAINGTVSDNFSVSGQVTFTGNTAVRINNAPDATPTSTTHSFQVGATSGINVRMDGNDILAVNNGVAGSLGIQGPGGSVSVFGAQGMDSTADVATVRGTLDTNILRAGRNSSTSPAVNILVDGESVNRLVVRADGQLLWSSGSAAADTNLFRNGANQLRTNDAMQVDGSLTTLGSIIARNLKSGSVVAPAPGGSGGTTSVSVSYPAMATIPNVVCQADTTADPADQNIQWYVTDLSTTGFTIKCFRSSNSPTRFMWIAMAV